MTSHKSVGTTFWRRATSFFGSQTLNNSAPTFNDSHVTFVKLYGERNTGTHFVQRMIRQNFRCQIIPGTLAEACPGYREAIEEQLKAAISDEAKRLWVRQAKIDAYFHGNLWSTIGWKHAVPPIDVILDRPDRDNILFVTVTKNPYAWALSLFRRPYEYIGLQRPVRLTDFLSEPWPTVERDNAPAILQSPIELWNLKVEGYSRLAKIADVIRCRYEDVLLNPTNFLTLVSNHLAKKNREFVIDPESAKKMDKGEKALDYYHDYYIGQRWRDELTSEDVALINRYLDTTVAQDMGYEMLHP